MKKIFSVLLCITMLMCSATGCKADNNSSIDSTADQSQSIEYETIEPPEDGWTVESIASTIRLCGKPIELPFTVGSLGEGFEFVDDTGCVLYNGHPAFVAAFINNDKSGDRFSTAVRRLGTYEQLSDEDFRNYFVINGVGIGSSKEDVIAAFGEPDFQSDSNFEYNADHDDNENSVKNIVRFGFGNLDKVQGMFVNLIDENEDSSYYTGTFNEEVFEHIIQNISLEGVKISMPCTLKDMGDGFEVSNPLVFEEKALATYALNYKDVYLGQIVYYSDHELTEEELENEKFSSISLYVNSPDQPLDNIDIAGMGIDSDYKKLESVLGQPTSKKHDGERKYYTYKLSEKKYIEFHFWNDSINSVIINFK